eukprot:CAMPEP_0115179692 /NCGR_PEP_ID=MMETSP0270-20121206/6538_1 /TAXON_ID=71861 /ORGANISM="Scrippsiella trochoidea, Strain CCMP3099" /LENGTH=59 /DNA_ID=CAMNT_0002592675 /DNA_START=545 /DNA_END=721 /DNA_ORIENTATION=+
MLTLVRFGGALHVLLDLLFCWGDCAAHDSALGTDPAHRLSELLGINKVILIEAWRWHAR